MDVEQDLDSLVLISGPEPQRTRLEEILTPMLSDLDGFDDSIAGQSAKNNDTITFRQLHAYFLCNHAGKSPPHEPGEVCHLPLGLYFNDGNLPNSISVMGFLFRHLGQPEQEYLSDYYEKMGWFYSKSQHNLNLVQDIPACNEV
ncbi:MAG: hypothetical protein MZV49_19795 [Rhodopseudomonas palustris]|nr:hypothetical protein [Rhodopseudomonas palustris]